MNATTYQTQLLEKIKNHYPHLSKNVIDAFLSTPRHEYISEFYKDGDLFVPSSPIKT